MAGKHGSLQQRIRERQQSGFVGRQGQVVQYRENLEFPADDDRRRFLFNIHGDAGVGKTFLTRQLERIAANDGALSAFIDESAEDLAAVMTVIPGDSPAAAPGSPSSKSEQPSTSSAATNSNPTRMHLTA